MSNKFWNSRKPKLPQRYAGTTLFNPRKRPQLPERLVFALILLSLVALLTACDCLPKQPPEMLPLPMPPALSEPTPSVSYSTQWRQLVESLEKKLTGTLTMPEPATTLGPNNKGTP